MSSRGCLLQGMAVEETKWLKIPLYKLYYLDDASNFLGLNNADLELLRTQYSEEEIEHILASLAWAGKNPEYDFASLLPNLRHKNPDIYMYLRKVYESLVVVQKGQ